MSAWIESHQALGTHRKLMKFARILRVEKAQAVGHLHFLWWWALDNAEDGYTGDLATEDIAEASAWNGDANAFLSALRESGFMDPDGKIHDWEIYSGRLIAKRVANRERAKKAYSSRRLRVDYEKSTGLPNPTQPNSTQPNPTQEESAEPVLQIHEDLALCSDFVDAWHEWVKVRKGMKKAKNWYALFAKQLDWLSNYPGPVAVEILNASIRNGWQGLFAPKVNAKPNGHRVIEIDAKIKEHSAWLEGSRAHDPKEQWRRGEIERLKSERATA